MKINNDLIDVVANSIKWNNIIDDHNTSNNIDTWIPVYNGYKMQHTDINSIVNRGLAIQTTQVTANPTYFDSADTDHNMVNKTGHVVEVLFRGKLKANVPNNSVLFTFPYKPVWQTTAIFGYGGRYDFDQNNGVRWCYVDGQGQLKTGELTAGKYIHVDIVYITNS